MREINSKIITQAISKAVIEANTILPESICKRIDIATENESNSQAVSVFIDMKENLKLAKKRRIPICQDTGMVVVFAELGQDVHIVGGGFEKAVNDGVADGYTKGFLRKSVVEDPLRRINTNNNTPAIIHTSIIDGEGINITIAPKGFGSENMSAIRMFNPTATENDIIEFVTHTVRTAGAKPCPPLVIGVGIGGDFEYATILSKKALCRDINEINIDSFYASLERRILDSVNSLGIGPQGFGGDTTALAVNIETFPTHIAGLPVAVNIGCHVTRHIKIKL